MSEPVAVRILDREFTVGVEPGERDSLVAVLTALNLAHELLQLRTESERRDEALNRTLGELNRKLDGLFDAPR